MTENDVEPEKQKNDQMKSEEKFSIGLISPISEIKNDDVYTRIHWNSMCTIIQNAIGNDDIDIKLVSDDDDSGIIQSRIVDNIYTKNLIICDVSSYNPNVMFELGLRLAFDKPIILIKDNLTKYIFDTSPIDHIEYPSDLNYIGITAFQNQLRKKVDYIKSHPSSITYLKHFSTVRIKTASVPDVEVSHSEAILGKIERLSNQMDQVQKRLGSESNVNEKKIRMQLKKDDELHYQSFELFPNDDGLGLNEERADQLTIMANKIVKSLKKKNMRPNKNLVLYIAERLGLPTDKLSEDEEYYLLKKVATIFFDS